MKTLAARFGLMLVWVGLAIVGAVLYGVLNDQMTLTLAPEYFTVFKHRQFARMLHQTGLLTAPPRVQALLIGTLATWWFGLFLGIVLSISSLVGRFPPLPTRFYLRAVVGIMLFTLCLSVLCGSVGYLVESLVRPDAAHWHFLTGIHDVRPAFAIGLWHDGAYVGGFVGTLWAGLWAQRQRRQGQDAAHSISNP